MGITNSIISQKNRSITFLKLFGYTSFGGLIGSSIGSAFDNQFAGLGIGVGTGLVVFGIEFIIDSISGR